MHSLLKILHYNFKVHTSAESVNLYLLLFMWSVILPAVVSMLHIYYQIFLRNGNSVLNFLFKMRFFSNTGAKRVDDKIKKRCQTIYINSCRFVLYVK